MRAFGGSGSGRHANQHGKPAQTTNALDKLDLVLEEIPHVREELGFLPLVTPTSQIVGTQAVINVVLGERYKTITKETSGVLKGEYGKRQHRLTLSCKLACWRAQKPLLVALRI